MESMKRRKWFVVIIADSRGKDLQQVINDQVRPGYDIRVLVSPGKGLVAAVCEAESKLFWWQPDQVYIVAGVCDITKKNKQTNTISLRETNPLLAISLYKFHMEAIRNSLTTKLGNNDCKIVFGELVGVNMARYNGTGYPDPQQDQLNNIVEGVNMEIVAQNTSQNLVTPWIARTIHKNRRDGRKIHRYHKMASDGVHLTDELRDTWAKEILKSIYKNTMKQVPRPTAYF